MGPPKETMQGKMSLQNIRRVWSIFFLALFIFLLIISDYRYLKGYNVALFLELNPLVWLSNLLTGWTVYKGLALSLITMIPMIFLGRFFCSWICPLGILNQWASRLLQRRRVSEEYEVNAYRTIYRFKYYIMTALLVLGLFGSLQIGLFDPIALVYRSFIVSVFPAGDTLTSAVYTKRPVFHGGTLISLIFIAIIFANRFITRLWCRAVCPLGALLGLISIGAVMRIQRDVEKCTDCKQCLRSCQGACDPHAELRIAECHVCMNCISDCPENALHYGLPTSLSSIHRPLDINRRRLIETAIAGILFFPMLKNSLTSESEAHAAVIRPPGSLPEPEFLRRCIKCSMCMRVCPTNVLHPALLEGGLEGLWTPILVNKIGYCEHHCVLCSQVCPTGAIQQISVEDKVGTPSKKPIKLGTAFYDRGRCLPWAMNVECIVCEEVCPTSPKAIWFEEKEIRRRDGSIRRLKMPFVDPTLCIGCGICENKCPVGDLPAIQVTSVGESRSKTNRMILKP
jgi:MauM/NapG family ferredoxin protein